jgi:activator of HSP90 ATPase
MKTKTIIQKVLIENASPDQIYDILMDSKKHAKLVNSTAKISKEVNGNFKIYDGYIEGKNIELEPKKKIVQLWRGDEDLWPKDHYSILTIFLEKTDNGTQINLMQEKVPEECYEDIEKGWYDFYWEPLKKMFKALT